MHVELQQAQGADNQPGAKSTSSVSAHHNITELPAPAAVDVTVPAEEFGTDSAHEENRPSLEGQETYYLQEPQSSPSTAGKRRSPAAMAPGTSAGFRV